MGSCGEPIGAVEVKVLTSQTHTYKLGRQPRSQGSLLSVHTEREREGRVREKLQNEPGCSVECDT